MFTKFAHTFAGDGIHLPAKFIFLNVIIAFGSFIVKECNAFYYRKLHYYLLNTNRYLSEIGVPSTIYQYGRHVPRGFLQRSANSALEVYFRSLTKYVPWKTPWKTGQQQRKRPWLSHRVHRNQWGTVSRIRVRTQQTSQCVTVSLMRDMQRVSSVTKKYTYSENNAFLTIVQIHNPKFLTSKIQNPDLKNWQNRNRCNFRIRKSVKILL